MSSNTIIAQRENQKRKTLGIIIVTQKQKAGHKKARGQGMAGKSPFRHSFPFDLSGQMHLLMFNQIKNIRDTCQIKLSQCSYNYPPLSCPPDMNLEINPKGITQQLKLDSLNMEVSDSNRMYGDIKEYGNLHQIS